MYICPTTGQVEEERAFQADYTPNGEVLRWNSLVDKDTQIEDPSTFVFLTETNIGYLKTDTAAMINVRHNGDKMNSL